jgi:hypothetical protein
MRSFPQPQRQDGPAITDADLVALLAGTLDVPPGLRPVADILAALTAAPAAGELAGESRAMTEFRRRARAPANRRHARPRTARLTSGIGAKLGAAAAGVAVVFGGAATAAFADKLPAPIQSFAHETIGAPTPHVRHGRPAHLRPAPGAPAHSERLAQRTPRAQAPLSPPATGPVTANGQGQNGKPHARGKPGNQQGPGQQGGNGQGQPGSDRGQSGGQAPGSIGPRQASAQATGRHGKPQRSGRPSNPPAQRQRGHPHSTAQRAVPPAPAAVTDMVIGP